MPIYTVEIDGAQYDLEGDHPPSEAEARGAVNSMARNPETLHSRMDEQLAGGADATMQERPGFGQRAFNYARNMGRNLSKLSPAARMLSGEGVTPAFVESLKSWIKMGGNLAHANPAELVTAPAGDVGDLVGLERPSGEEHDPAEAAVNVALMPLLAETGGGGLRFAPSLVERAGARAAAGLLNRGSQLARSRAAARSFDLQRPTTGRAATAEDIAMEVVEGTPALEGHLEGVGVGSRETLARRARARQALAAQEQDMLHNVETPVDVAPASARMRAEAQRRVTTPPEHMERFERDTGIVDEFGDPVMGTEDRLVPGAEATQDPALVQSLRGEADFLDNLASQYPDGRVPGGELFKQKATAGARIAKAYERLPGDVQSAGQQAGKSLKANLTQELRTQLPEVPSAQIDRAYRVWKNAAVNFERSRLSALTNRGRGELVKLIASRMSGAMLGAAAGATSGSALYTLGGAFGGVMLGESAIWGSLRAQEYARLSRLLNSGRTAEAAELVNSLTARGATAEDLSAQADRHRRARQALNNQAEGVVGQ